MNRDEKTVFHDLLLWVQKNRYTPSDSEMIVFKGCSERTRNAALSNLFFLGTVTYGIMSNFVPTSRFRSRLAMAGFVGGLGGYYGAENAGRKCLSNVLQLTDSPLAAKARVLVTERHAEKPAVFQKYLDVFPMDRSQDESLIAQVLAGHTQSRSQPATHNNEPGEEERETQVELLTGRGPLTRRFPQREAVVEPAEEKDDDDEAVSTNAYRRPPQSKPAHWASARSRLPDEVQPAHPFGGDSGPTPTAPSNQRKRFNKYGDEVTD